jgi:putative acetyltransferase
MDPATDAGSDARGQPAPDGAASRVDVRPEPLDSPVALEPIAALNEELSRDYPPSQRFHSLATEEVAEGSGAFLVAWLDGAPAGCGAVRVISPGVAELKRMYVVPAVRGRGVSRAILTELETRTTALGATRVVLETGDKAHAALGLYESAGYTQIPCFGAYAASPTSICFERYLA